MIIRGFEMIFLLHGLHQIFQFQSLGDIQIGDDISLVFPVLRTLWSSDMLWLHEHVAKNNVIDEREMCERKVLNDWK